MDFSGKPETENLRRPCQVCEERREAAAGAAFALKMHSCAENQFAGVVQFAEVRSKNFPPHKQWLGVHKSGAGFWWENLIDVVGGCFFNYGVSHVNL